MILKLTVSVILVIVSVNANILPYLQIPNHDGVRRVVHLTAENFATAVSSTNTIIVIIKDPVLKSTACLSDSEHFAELTAQVLQKKNIAVYEAYPDILKAEAQDVNVISVNPGDVYIYKNGRGAPYFGQRSATAIINHLFKVNDTNISVIAGKIDKVAFDTVEETKVVGFFMQGTADFQAFETAAASLSPFVKFYAAFDRVVAKHLKLSVVGEIHLIKPFSKVPAVCPHNPASTVDIEAFVMANPGSLLSKLNENNMYDPRFSDPTKVMVLAVASKASSLGNYFYRLVTKLVKNNANNTEFEKLNIVWVEPEIFPNIYLIMDELETNSSIPKQLPAFGVLDNANTKGLWLNTSSLNCSGDKNADVQNLQVLQDFLTQVINQTIAPATLASGIQSFTKTPTSQSVTENTDVVLECIVGNPTGDCVWLKNGRNIGYNLDRYPHYNWRGDQASGDCSLLITGAQALRDGGDWVCEMTGDLNNPALSSPPIRLTITGTQTSGKGTQKAEL